MTGPLDVTLTIADSVLFFSRPAGWESRAGYVVRISEVLEESCSFPPLQSSRPATLPQIQGS